MQIKSSVIFEQEMNALEILMAFVTHSVLSGWEVGGGDVISYKNHIYLLKPDVVSQICLLLQYCVKQSNISSRHFEVSIWFVSIFLLFVFLSS